MHEFKDIESVLVALFNCISKLDNKKYDANLVNGVIDKFASYSLTKIEFGAS